MFSTGTHFELIPIFWNCGSFLFCFQNSHFLEQWVIPFLFSTGTHIILSLVPVQLIGPVNYYCVVVSCLWPGNQVSYSFLLQCHLQLMGYRIRIWQVLGKGK